MLLYNPVQRLQESSHASDNVKAPVFLFRRRSRDRYKSADGHGTALQVPVPAGSAL